MISSVAAKTVLHSPSGGTERLTRQIAIAVLAPRQYDASVIAKVQTCLLDVIGAALEARDLPWSRQAAQIATPVAGGARIIGSSLRTTPGDAAFANAVRGHGLVREDMHAGSISHLGVVVIPALLSLAQTHRATGMAFVSAAVAGYEVGAKIGAVLFDTELARLFRPTGTTGPIAAAAAASRLLGLDVDQTTSAIALAANTTGGLNEWPAVGGGEMFFHPGFAARSGITASQLAAFGANASESALDGSSGLFSAMRRKADMPSVRFFDSPPEILSVYNKPVPACNFAQTACQAALSIRIGNDVPLDALRAVRIRVPRAAARYPGCASTGPFDRLLQAKMSIPFSVAATLCRGAIAEANYTLPAGPDIVRLIGLTTLEEDNALTAAFPSRQGAIVDLLFEDRRLTARLDDVVAATPEEVRARCSRAAAEALGEDRARAILAFVDDLPATADVGVIGDLLATSEDEA